MLLALGHRQAEHVWSDAADKDRVPIDMQMLGSDGSSHVRACRIDEIDCMSKEQKNVLKAVRTQAHGY